MRIVMVLPRCFRCPPGARIQQVESAVAVRLHRVHEYDLVFLRGLPGKADADVPAVVVAVHRPAEIGLVEEGLRLCELVEVQTFCILLRDTLAKRGEEPELVAADGTSQSGCRVPE